MGDAEHMDALEQLFVQDRRLAAIERVFVGGARLRACLRHRLQRAAVDAGGERAQRRIDRDREGHGRFDRLLLAVAEGALGGDDGKAAADRDVDAGRSERDWMLAGGAVPEETCKRVIANNRCRHRHGGLH